MTKIRDASPKIVATQAEKPSRTVFSNHRADGTALSLDNLPEALSSLLDRENQADGLSFLSRLPDAFTPLAFFDPEYRGVLDYQSYGNEGARQKGRAALAQMTEEVIRGFIVEISRILTPRGHLMLWVDKFHLAEGVRGWIDESQMKIVDLVTWDKERIGMGYRTRRRSEYLLAIQKLPLRAKGVWTAHDIPDVWREKLTSPKGERHAHAKPEGLQRALIAATTSPGEIVVDPAAGSFSVMRAALAEGRHFLGCDLKAPSQRDARPHAKEKSP